MIDAFKLVQWDTYFLKGKWAWNFTDVFLGFNYTKCLKFHVNACTVKPQTNIGTLYTIAYGIINQI